MIRYLDEVKALNLPLGDYAICASAVLAARGIRPNKDIDLLVRPEVFEALSKEHPITEKNGIRGIEIGNLEIFCSWGNFIEDPMQIIERAEIRDGYPLMNLEHFKAWKKWAGREKDIEDLRLLEKWESVRTYS